MKTLGNISPSKGSNKKKKRVGRGIGSTGKTSGRGHGGMKKRRGSMTRAGFEGGQMPLYRRLPKRGFTNIFRIEYDVVNLDQLSKFTGKDKITPADMYKSGLIGKASNPVKLLGRGKLDKAINVAVHKVSASAKAALEKAGGKIELLQTKKPENKEAVVAKEQKKKA